MRANAALVLLCSFVVFLTACAEGGSTSPTTGGTPPAGPTLAFLTTTLPAATENVQYNASISATGSATGNYAWSISAGTPTGSFSSGGSTPGQLAISGLFTPSGSYTFNVTVGDAAGQSLTRPFTIVVNASTAMALVSMPYTGAWEDQAFQTQFYAQGGTQPFTWTMPSGTLPSGLALTPQNNFADLAGTPTQSGQFNFTVRVDDSAGQFATLNYQLYVFPARTWTLLSGAPVDQQGSACLDLFNRLWVWGGLSGTTPGQGQPINTGYSWPLSGSTTPITTANAPSPRFAHSAVSTGSAMIVFGGRDSANVLGDGRKLTFSPQSWSAISATGAPSARNSHSAVWTGTEMIVWGGVDPQGNTLNDGAAYNPTSDTWRAISSAGAPMSRANHRAEIVGGRMVVFGGQWSSTTSIPADLYNGGVYDIASDTWATFGSYSSGTGATPTLVCMNVAEALIWGLPGTNQGIALSLPSQSFGYLSTLNAPTTRTGHSATWTGKYMLVFGGEATGPLNDGAAYSPTTDAWIANATGAPQARKNNKAFWIGHQVLIFGGEGLNGSGQPVMLGEAALYTP